MKTFFCTMFAFMSLASCAGTDLKGNEYVLETPKYSNEVTLGFDKSKNTFYGGALNRYFGNYTVKGDKINFTRAGSTMMAGTVVQMNDESRYLKTLEGEKSFKIEGDKLILKSIDGTEAVFKKK